MAKSGPLSAAASGKYNVYIPNRTSNPYVSFDTLAEAQADVTANANGVILDPAGKLDPTIQSWSGWSTYQANFPAAPVVLNPTAPSAPATPPPPTGKNDLTANKYNVWIPPAYVQQAVLASAPAATSFTNGAYVPFNTLAEAQAYVTQSNAGVIFDGQGALYAGQVWASANQFAPQAHNGGLVADAKKNSINVWFPQQYVQNLGTAPSGVTFTNGAFYPVASLAEAQAEVTARGLGVIVDANGSLSPTQTWGQAAKFATQLTNSRLTPQETKNTFNVWTPAALVPNLGVTTPANFPNGSYLSFATAAEAQAHVQAVGMGIVLDDKGKVDATQPWASFGPYAAQLLNPDLQANAKSGDFNVWFPAQYVAKLGTVANAATFTNGAYLSFASEAEAQAHVTQRGFGVILDQQGNMAATQTWNQATQFAKQLTNARLTPTPTKNSFNVWTPPAVVGNLGLGNAAPFTAGGAYLSFATAAEAQAHVSAVGLGVILDPAGKVDATQPWAQYGSYAAQLRNADVSPTATSGKYNVWFPQNYVGNLGAFPNSPTLTNGGYIAFDSAAEAQAHVTQRTFGVILDPQGAMDATQTWAQASQFAAQLSNARLTPAPTKGMFNVWTPAANVPSLGIANPQAYPQGSYLSFKTAAEAQAHVGMVGFGVILDAAGNADATQPWSGAGPFAAQLLNPKLETKPRPGAFNVWFPQQYVASLGSIDVKKFPRGAFLSFATEAEAQAHATQRAFGVVLDDKGALAATQPWYQATQMTAQLSNFKLEAKPAAGTFNVWFPQQFLPGIGVDANAFQSGAYLSFASAAEAQAEVNARGQGVILDAAGALDATQPWGQAASYAAQLANKDLISSPPSGKFAVWFPYSQLTTVGVAPGAFPTGAWLPFNTEADAQAHVAARGTGVVLDQAGALSATQPWSSATQFAGQLKNPQLKATKVAGQFNVWFPPDTLGTVGVDPMAFQNGAYAGFKTLAEAQAEATARGVGVIYDDKGNYDSSAQTWANATLYVPVWPPPTVTGDTAPIAGGTADILGVYGEPTPTGSHIVIRTHNALLNETLTYALYTTINGTLLKIKDLGTKAMTPSSYVLDADFNLDYAELSKVLQQGGAPLSIGKGAKLSVMVTWPSGHNQGSGQGGAGKDSFVAA